MLHCQYPNSSLAFPWPTHANEKQTDECTGFNGDDYHSTFLVPFPKQIASLEAANAGSSKFALARHVALASRRQDFLNEHAWQ